MACQERCEGGLPCAFWLPAATGRTSNAPAAVQVFVFCCAHADKVKKYIQESKWVRQPFMNVHTVMATNCLSVGDAMRVMYGKDVIKHDFVLVSADTVSNMDLTTCLHEHRERRAKDKNCLMTMVRLVLTIS